MTEDDIRKVIQKVPGLTDFGIGIFRGHGPALSPAHREPRVREEQEKLVAGAGACTRVCRWLEGLTREAPSTRTSAVTA